ncbi:PPC domain-containing DNA-binding protein [Kitasatospora azatica]|uniref:PPC domain-containing DNA-binding protein n=1 Tax=Kitasatospora azatica TaxID=58347 RepID=UPI0006910597|nr:DUF296 domain-containing protein [Kitasatospora azatica]
MHTTVKSEGPQRAYELVFETGEEIIGGLRAFAIAERLAPSEFNAIGGVHQADLGFYNLTDGTFNPVPFHRDQCEVLSLIGDITPEADKPGGYNVHGHVVLGSPDGQANGGHLLHAITRPILFVTIEELEHAKPAHH